MNQFIPQSKEPLKALEFFAGIGLARAGMGTFGISTIWANDYDPSKQLMYSKQWDGSEYRLADIHEIRGESVPTADIAWSSSPCTDLSLAGNRVGLRGGRESSAFFGFTRVLREMGERKPKVVVLENVLGLASSNKGADLRAAALEFNELGYSVDCIVLDTLHFLPQSRPRLFMVGALEPRGGGSLDESLRPKKISSIHSDPAIDTFLSPLPQLPDLVTEGLTSGIIERLDPTDKRWWHQERVENFVHSMSDVQRQRLRNYVQSPLIVARTAYRRTRNGIPVWEMRAEDVSGCLRTARGGSSKQAVVIMGQGSVNIRWMTGLEYARLMGAGWFNLDGLRESQIHYGFGDAVSVPAVSWITANMVLPVLGTPTSSSPALKPSLLSNG